MGLSEHKVPQNPMVYDHCPIILRQTHMYFCRQLVGKVFQDVLQVGRGAAPMICLGHCYILANFAFFSAF